jgi:putative restriction endonuclease
MPKTFDNITKSTERALQVWLILIGKAYNHQTMTYIELANLMGYNDARPIRNFLIPIMNYCDQNDLPPLTVLVVSKEKGTPGTGLTTVDNPDLDRQRVFNYNWYNLYPPTPEEFQNI